jgi:pimeloyl-ACP methyl ester carboxylesterase
MATFVLVSGAWHAAWCWERIVPLLEAAGHRVLAPNLDGMNPDDPGSDDPRFLADPIALWADQLGEVIRKQYGKVVLVGHSRGGVVISETAERVPERIERLVYLAAFLVPDGGAIVPTLAAHTQGGEAPQVTMPAGEGLVAVNPEFAIPVFYNTTESKWAERAAGLLVPEPGASLVTPVHVTEERFGTVPRSYIECLQDNAVPMEAQLAMQAALPCESVTTLDTDHSPFYSAPEELAARLAELAGMKGEEI